MSSPLGRLYRPDPTPEESLARTAKIIGLKRDALKAGLALVDLTAVKCPERRRMIAEEARAQIGGATR